MHPPAHQPQRSTAGFWIVIVLLVVGLGASVMLNLGLAAALFGKSAAAFATEDAGVDEYPQLQEVWSYGDGDVKAARIALTGIILRESDDGLFAVPQDRIAMIESQIRAAQNDEEVKAIILEVDSPGGGITPSDELYRALMTFKESATGRVVVVFMRDLAASGGYYVAMAGDWLVAEPTTVVGSIGVIMQALNIKGLSEKLGVRDVTIKSGANKDLLNPFNDTPPEQVAILQGMIDAMYNHFVGIVARSRNMDMDALKRLADGRVFVAGEALENRLIDQIGYWDDVTARTAELLGVDQVKVIRYEHHTDFLEWLSTVRNPLPQPSTLLDLHRPRLLYLWQP